jgi:hypothetical protein
MNTDYSLVSSFYGPGNAGCWLFTICSLFVSWTINIKTSRKDVISNDFITVLLYPTVAAGHIVYQLHRLPENYQRLYPQTHVQNLSLGLPLSKHP